MFGSPLSSPDHVHDHDDDDDDNNDSNADDAKMAFTFWPVPVRTAQFGLIKNRGF